MRKSIVSETDLDTVGSTPDTAIGPACGGRLKGKGSCSPKNGRLIWTVQKGTVSRFQLTVRFVKQ